MQNIVAVPEKRTKKLFLKSCIHHHTICFISNFTPLRLKKMCFHQREKWRNLFGSSGHPVVWFYPRTELSFPLSRYLAFFTGLYCIVCTDQKNLQKTSLKV